MDARRIARTPRSLADYPAYLRRRLERNRLLARRTIIGIFKAHRCRYSRKIRLVQMRRRLQQYHRHADRAASADTDDIQVRQPGSAARLRFPNEDSDSHQTGVQESKIRRGYGSHEYR